MPGICSKKGNKVVLAIAAIGLAALGVARFHDAQTKLNQFYREAADYKQLYESTRAQLEVVYENKRNLESLLQRESSDHKSTKEEFLAHRLEAEDQLAKQKLEADNRYTALDQQFKLFKDQKDDDVSSVQLELNICQNELQKMNVKQKDEVANLKKTLQENKDTMEQLKSSLTSLRANYTACGKRMRTAEGNLKVVQGNYTECGSRRRNCEAKLQSLQQSSNTEVKVQLQKEHKKPLHKIELKPQPPVNENVEEEHIPKGENRRRRQAVQQPAYKRQQLYLANAVETQNLSDKGRNYDTLARIQDPQVDMAPYSNRLGHELPQQVRSEHSTNKYILREEPARQIVKQFEDQSLKMQTEHANQRMLINKPQMSDGKGLSVNHVPSLDQFSAQNRGEVSDVNSNVPMPVYKKSSEKFQGKRLKKSKVNSRIKNGVKNLNKSPLEVPKTEVVGTFKKQAEDAELESADKSIKDDNHKLGFSSDSHSKKVQNNVIAEQNFNSLHQQIPTPLNREKEAEEQSHDVQINSVQGNVNKLHNHIPSANDNIREKLDMNNERHSSSAQVKVAEKSSSNQSPVAAGHSINAKNGFNAENFETNVKTKDEKSVDNMDRQIPAPGDDIKMNKDNKMIKKPETNAQIKRKYNTPEMKTSKDRIVLHSYQESERVSHNAFNERNPELHPRVNVNEKEQSEINELNHKFGLVPKDRNDYQLNGNLNPNSEHLKLPNKKNSLLQNPLLLHGKPMLGAYFQNYNPQFSWRQPGKQEKHRIEHESELRSIENHDSSNNVVDGNVGKEIPIDNQLELKHRHGGDERGEIIDRKLEQGLEPLEEEEDLNRQA